MWNRFIRKATRPPILILPQQPAWPALFGEGLGRVQPSASEAIMSFSYKAIIACLNDGRYKKHWRCYFARISDIQLVCSRSIQLKEERIILIFWDGKMYLFLHAGYGKSLVYQVFVRAWRYETQLFMPYWYEALTHMKPSPKKAPATQCY